MDYNTLRHMSQEDVDNLYVEYIGPILPVVKHESVFKDRQGTDRGQRRRAIGKLLIQETHPTRHDVDCSVYGPLSIEPTGGLYRQLLDIDVPYRTGTGHDLSMLVRLFEVPRGNIPLLSDYEHVASCGDCKGTSGSCPGFAPEIQDIHKSAPSLYVIVTTLDMAWTMKWASLNNWVYALTWCDRLTTAYVRRMMKSFAGHTTFGAGSCAGKCKPCAVLNGNKCVEPDKRQHSMEAVGIDCDRLHHMIYDEYLPWCHKGIPAVPSYMSRYTGILP